MNSLKNKKNLIPQNHPISFFNTPHSLHLPARGIRWTCRRGRPWAWSRAGTSWAPASRWRRWCRPWQPPPPARSLASSTRSRPSAPWAGPDSAIDHHHHHHQQIRTTTREEKKNNPRDLDHQNRPNKSKKTSKNRGRRRIGRNDGGKGGICMDRYSAAAAAEEDVVEEVAVRHGCSSRQLPRRGWCLIYPRKILRWWAFEAHGPIYHEPKPNTSS